MRLYNIYTEQYITNYIIEIEYKDYLYKHTIE